MSSGLALTLTLLLLLANAFFVASEFAIVKIRPTRVRELVARGDRRARMLEGITRRLDAYLSANQLGITLCSISIGWLGEPALARLLHPLLAPLGGVETATVRALSFGIGFGLITFLHTVLGELAPKSLAIQRTEPVALWTAGPLRAFYFLAYPLIWTLNGASNLFVRAIGLRPASEAEFLHSPQELRLVLQHARMEPDARRLIDRVFDYTHRVARHVMTQRADVVVLEAGRSFDENLAVALAHQYTRYPLVAPGTGRVVGYIHIKDVFATLARGQHPQRMRELVREPIYCTEETPLEWLRREFQRRRVHLAIVLGADHAFRGIVTLEDTLEEFVGEIQDEQDQGEEAPIVRKSARIDELDARLTLDVVEREVGLHLDAPSPSLDTLGAYVESLLEDPPLPGDSVVISGFRVVVQSVRDGRIRRLEIERPTPVEAAEAVS